MDLYERSRNRAGFIIQKALGYETMLSYSNIILVVKYNLLYRVNPLKDEMDEDLRNYTRYGLC